MARPQSHEFSPRSFEARPRIAKRIRSYSRCSAGPSARATAAKMPRRDFTSDTVLRCTLRKLRARALDRTRATWPRTNGRAVSLAEFARGHVDEWRIHNRATPRRVRYSRNFLSRLPEEGKDRRDEIGGVPLTLIVKPPRRINRKTGARGARA